MSAPETQAAKRRVVLPKAIVVTSLIVLAVIGLLIAGARYGVLLPQTRLLIEAGADGLKVGRLGRLKIEGLSGFLHGHAREESELDEPRGLLVAGGQAIECLAEFEHIDAAWGGELRFLDVVPVQ